MMASPAAVAACSSGSKSSQTASTGSAEDPGTTGDGSSGTSDPDTPTSANAAAIHEAADSLEADLARSFAATPFEDLATRLAEGLRTVAAASEDAPEVLSHKIRTTVEGALVPLAAWCADFVTADDPTLDSVEADMAALTAALEANRRAIADS